MAEERKVSVDLEVTKSGETGAFEQTAGEIQKLDQAAAASGDGLEQLGEKSAEAAGAAGELKSEVSGAGQAATTATGPITSLGTATETTGNKAATSRQKLEEMFLKVGLAMPVLHEAERALQGLEEGLNTVAEAAGGTGKEFDGLGSKFGAFTASITQFFDKVGNIDDAFAAFANTNGSLIERLDAAKEALDGLSPSAQKLKDSITGTDEKLTAEAEALGRVIHQMENAGQVHEREAGRIGKALADMAKKAEEAGVDLGESFNQQLQKYPELDKASTKRAKTLADEGAAATKSAEEQTTAFDSIQEASSAAGDGLDTATEGATNLGQAADTGKAGVAGLADQLAALPEATSGIQTAFEGLNQLALDGLTAAVASLRSELQAATVDAQNLGAALAAADAGNGTT